MASLDPQREHYNKLLATALDLKPPEGSLEDAIRAGYALAAVPNQPPLKDTQVGMIAHAVTVWQEKDFHFREFHRVLKEIGTLLDLRDAKDKIEEENQILRLENAELRALVIPKPDTP